MKKMSDQELNEKSSRHSGSPKAKTKKPKKEKRDKNYPHIERQSSEEESLVQGDVSFSGKLKAKKKNVFKLGAGSKKSSTEVDSKIKSKKKSVKSAKPKDEGEKKSVSHEPLFGIQLEEAVRRSPAYDKVPVPVFLRRAIDYVNDHLNTEGIYRISAPLSALKEMRKRLEEEPNVDLGFTDVHNATGIVKMFFRELPESLMADDLQLHLLSILNDPASSLQNRDMALDELIGHELRTRLTTERFMTLAYVFLHVKRILQHTQENKMDFVNMGLMLWQTLRINHQSLLTFLLKHTGAIFADIQLKRYDPNAVESDRFPGSAFTLREELSKQEALLAALHEEAHHSPASQTAEIEQRLWDVQAVVTQLRRNLKRLQSDSAPKSGGADSADGPHENGAHKDAAVGPTLEMFEEKQLWAVQMTLRQRIAEERAAIESLRQELLELLHEDDSSSGDDGEFDDASQTPPDDEDMDAVAKEMSELEAQRDELVTKIIDERNATAHAMAELEMLTMDDDVDCDVIITRL